MLALELIIRFVGQSRRPPDGSRREAERLVRLTAANHDIEKRAAVAVRGILFLLTGLLLGGCMQATSDRPPPLSDANFTARDRQQLANPPYQQASIPEAYQIKSFNSTGRKR